MKLASGREIDTSCPFMGDCWAAQGCQYGSCPPTLLDTLERSAAMEHENSLLHRGRHLDPDLEAVCGPKHRFRKTRVEISP
jgi:hypothetical protein